MSSVQEVAYILVTFDVISGSCEKIYLHIGPKRSIKITDLFTPGPNVPRVLSVKLSSGL